MRNQHRIPSQMANPRESHHFANSDRPTPFDPNRKMPAQKLTTSIRLHHPPPPEKKKKKKKTRSLSHQFILKNFAINIYNLLGCFSFPVGFASNLGPDKKGTKSNPLHYSFVLLRSSDPISHHRLSSAFGFHSWVSSLLNSVI
jgi:hypothetical protein